MAPRFLHKYTPQVPIEVTEWSADDYAKAFTTPVINSHNKVLPGHVYDKSMSWSERAEWYNGVKGIDDAASLVTHGWQAGAARLASIVSDVQPPQSPQTRRRKPAWCESGDTLDVDRAMAGDMAPWRMAIRQITSGPRHLELNVHLGGACYRDAESLFWLSAPAIVLTDLLEQAGFSVRLVGCNFGTSNTDGKLYNHTVVVKDYSEPLRIDLAAALLAHAGTWRTLGFLAMVTHSELAYNTGFGLNNIYGGLAQIKDTLVSAGCWHDGSVAMTDCYDKASAIAEVNRVLASFQTV